MITLLDTVGPAVWRASWQAAALAVVVLLLLRCLGERLAPRWRFLLWGVVLTRLLVVATPVSPWSAFNLARRTPAAGARPVAPREAEATPAPLPHGADGTGGPHDAGVAPPPVADPGPEPAPAWVGVPAEAPSRSSAAATAGTPPGGGRFDAVLVTRVLSAVWLGGCLLLGLKLLATALVLRRRLSACRPVADAAVLELLRACCRRIGLRRAPALLVTPACLSPCLVGTRKPRIVVSEAVLTQTSTVRLGHVLMHELAHLVRGDLWTNWLLLTARVLHWFNPVCWGTVRALQAEREAACDDLAFAALGEAERSAYAATLVELAASQAPSALAPGLIGLFASTCRVRARVERLLRSPPATRLGAPVAAGLLLALALVGLTDALPGAGAQAPKEAAPAGRGEEPRAKNHTVSGRCVSYPDDAPLAGVTVRLYRVEGRTSPPVEIARTVTDASGRFTFTGLEPPRPENHLDLLDYGVIGFAEDRPIAVGVRDPGRRQEALTVRVPLLREQPQAVALRMTREAATLSGKVIDAAGQPVAGATVIPCWIRRPVPGLLSATTDAEGKFKIDKVGVYRTRGGTALPLGFAVRHPNHPETTGEARALPAEVVVTLPAGCVVTGTVTDGVTGQPGAGALITARRVDDEWGESFAAADAAGRFRLVVPEGRYSFLAEAKDRVCVAVTDRDCPAGAKVEVPPLRLIGGGFIAGRVVNTATGQPVAVSERGDPIMLGLFGPSQPEGRVIAPARLAAVDREGRFLLRAAPGDNFPYFVNTHGTRMAWDTRKQPPVVVKDGETTVYNLLITPPIPPEEKLKKARKLVGRLPADRSARAEQILLEFRKLSSTVDETELWCLLLRELVTLGRDAVPQVCAELDRTTEDVTLRRLGFTLRAVGDARAVPALIRAIPRSLVRPSSDYGLIVKDQELMDFMQTHHLAGGKGGTYFDLGRPVREICGALHRLTGQDFKDAEVFNIHLSEDPRRQVLQRRIYRRLAQQWQAWWEANWRKFTDDAAYQKVNLGVADEPLPPAPQALGKAARLAGEIGGAVLSPATERGKYVWHAYDLDTGYAPKWPTGIPRDEAARDAKQVADWAAQSGADLICVTHRSPDGAETFVLQALGMKVWEISPRDLRNLDRLIAAGKLPEGRPVGDLLMHYDAQAQRLVADANAAFLFVTREGNRGVIETTDRVTRTANLNGRLGGPPPGVGFHKGVRFNVKAIIP